MTIVRMPFVRRLSVNERAPKHGAIEISDMPGDAVVSPDRGLLSPWQHEIERLCEVDGLARFGVAVVADAASMFDLTTERYNGHEWVIEHDPIVDLAMKALFRDGEASLFWRNIWHWRSVGEGWYVNLGEDGKADRIEVVATSAVTRHSRGGYLVKFRPDGTERRGTAVWRPESKMLRFWNPDPRWLHMSQSPMRSILNDLRRYRLLGNTIDATARSAMLARGLVWMPEEAVAPSSTKTVDPSKPAEMPRLAKAYYEASRRALDQDGDRVDVAAVAPLLVWYKNDLQKPFHMGFNVPFDTQLLGLRAEAAESAGRGLDLPAVMVVNGGQGGGITTGTHSNRSNHWTDLLIDRRFIEGTVQKSVNPICHEHLTKLLRMFLRTLSERGIFKDDPGGWRVGFDSSKVSLSASPDPNTAIEGYKLGLLAPSKVRVAIGFKPEDGPTPGEAMQVLHFLKNSAQQDTMAEPSVDTSHAIAASLPNRRRERIIISRALPPVPVDQRKRQQAAVLAKINQIDQRTVAEVMGALDAAYSQAVPPNSRTSPSKRDAALVLLLHRILEVGNDARLRAAESIDGLTNDLIAATANSAHFVELAIQMVLAAGIDPSSPGYRQAIIQVARDAVSISAGAQVSPTPATGLSAEDDARRRLDNVVNTVVDDPDELDWEWQHAFYGEPNHPYPEHVDLDGQTFDAAGPPGQWPGDHFGCTCELIPKVRF